MRQGSEDRESPAGVLPLVVFVIDGQRYGLPLPCVERVLPMIAVAPLPKSPPITLGVINLHGRVLPVVDLRRHFNLPLREYGLTTHLLVVHTTQRQLGLPVDEVVGVMEVSRSAVTPPTILTGIGHVLGIVPLADGLLFIHDLERVLSLDEERSLARALGETEG